MRKPTEKTLQVHFECVCGNNSVYEDTVTVKYKDLSKSGIIRKKDKKTGKYFLLYPIHHQECNCFDQF